MKKHTFKDLAEMVINMRDARIHETVVESINEELSHVQKNNNVIYSLSVLNNKFYLNENNNEIKFYGRRVYQGQSQILYEYSKNMDKFANNKVFDIVWLQIGAYENSPEKSMKEQKQIFHKYYKNLFRILGSQKYIDKVKSKMPQEYKNSYVQELMASPFILKYMDIEDVKYITDEYWDQLKDKLKISIGKAWAIDRVSNKRKMNDKTFWDNISEAQTVFNAYSNMSVSLISTDKLNLLDVILKKIFELSVDIKGIRNNEKLMSIERGNLLRNITSKRAFDNKNEDFYIDLFNITNKEDLQVIHVDINKQGFVIKENQFAIIFKNFLNKNKSFSFFALRSFLMSTEKQRKMLENSKHIIERIEFTDKKHFVFGQKIEEDKMSFVVSRKLKKQYGKEIIDVIATSAMKYLESFQTKNIYLTDEESRNLAISLGEVINSVVRAYELSHKLEDLSEDKKVTRNRRKI